jgi:uncharacterized membrane protein YkoI
MQQAQHIPGFMMAFGLLLVPMSLGGTAASAYAVLADAVESPGNDHDLSRTQATALVQKRYGARVVRLAVSDEGGRHLYVFRLLSEGGKVWQVRIDARTGAEVP